MSTQKLHAFEKTSIQSRMAIKRLDAVLDNNRASEFEKDLASRLRDQFRCIREMIPEEYQDVDLLKE